MTSSSRSTASATRSLAIHGRGRDNFARQMAALDNLRELGIPFRFNVTMIRDNLDLTGGDRSRWRARRAPGW